MTLLALEDRLICLRFFDEAQFNARTTIRARHLRWIVALNDLGSRVVMMGKGRNLRALELLHYMLMQYSVVLFVITDIIIWRLGRAS